MAGRQAARFAVHPAIAYIRCMRATKLLPRLVVADASRAMAFYRKAFGATEVECHRTPDGKVVHAELSMDGFSFAGHLWIISTPVAAGR